MTRPYRTWLTGLFILLAAGAWPRAQGVAAEHQLKAAFVSKFPQFIAWPESALQNRTRVELCVATPNPFGSVLGDLLAGERLGSRPMTVREVVSEQVLDSCQLLFIPDLPSSERRALLARTQGLPILTVGESGDFLEAGGMIELRMVGGRVRFEIDAAAADRAGLRLSSQLLQLALAVRGRQT